MTTEIVKLLKKLLIIPSDVNDRDACLDILETVQQELEGFCFIPFARDGIPSLLYTNRPEPTKVCKIIFNAHLDVVPGQPDQFIPVEKDGRIYCRGAYDMKAAAAVMVMLFRDIAKKLPYTLGLQLTTDEEIVGFKGVNYQLEQGVQTDFVISGEGGNNFSIINQLRGLHVVKLQASGKDAHAGHLWYGENALLNLYKVIDMIMQLYPTPKKPSWQTTINLSRIETSNTAHNMVPADATALLDIRVIPEDSDLVLKKIKSLLPPDVTMEIIKSAPSHHTSSKDMYVQQLIKAFRDTTKTNPEIRYNYAGSDLSFFAMKGIKGVEFGPKGNGHHSSEEWVEVENLATYYEVLKKFLLSFGK